MINLDSVSAKILEALKENEATRFIPFACFLAEVLTSEDFDVLDQLKDRVGASQANAWLCDVMVTSGKYDKDDEGNIIVK